MTFNQKHKSVKNALRVLWHVQDSSDGWSYESKLVSKEVVLVTLVLKHFSVKSIVDQQITNLINLEHLDGWTFLGKKCRSHHFSLKSIMDHYITNNLINSVHQTPFFLVLNEHNCSFRKVCLASFNSYLKILCIKIENKNYQ